MPYNNAPISPPDEITGSSSLPLARVKKIIAQDEDVQQCSNGAAFAISVATEIFIRYLTEQAYNVVKSERKPKRNIAYKDIATAVARIDNLEFLNDVVPKTRTFRQFKEDKEREKAEAKKAPSGLSGLTNGINGETTKNMIDHIMQKHKHQLALGDEEPETNGAIHGEDPSQPPPVNGSPIVDRTLHPSPHSHPEPARDIEMTG